jgi:hypothetical protein
MNQLQIVHSLARLQCTKCGAEANASCDCGEPYKPVEIAKDYARKNPTASIREISAQTGVSHASAQRAKSRVSPDTPVTGRDGKTYPKVRTVESQSFTDAKLAFQFLTSAAEYFDKAGPEITAEVFAAFGGSKKKQARVAIEIVANIFLHLAEVERREESESEGESEAIEA